MSYVLYGRPRWGSAIVEAQLAWYGLPFKLEFVGDLLVCLLAVEVDEVRYDLQHTPARSAQSLRDPDELVGLGVEYVALDALYAESDIISLHVPLNDSTRGMLGKQELAQMKKSAIIVNTSRGPVVEEKALYKALKERWIAGAAIDVFESEPILQGHPLLRLENAVCTPHLGYVEADSYEMYFRAAFENVLAFVRGEPTHIINPEALKVAR